MMNFPLELRFKLIAIASQIYVRDAAGVLLIYVRQKLFKLKEDVVVYGDESQARPLYRIRADRIIDIGAMYTVSDESTGATLGSIRQRGLRSFWRAHYEIQDARGEAFTVREESVFIRILDSVMGQIPILGGLTGYAFNAAYRITRTRSGDAVMRVVKRPALFEGRFRIEALGLLSEAEERLLVLSSMMLLLLERRRS